MFAAAQMGFAKFVRLKRKDRDDQLIHLDEIASATLRMNMVLARRVIPFIECEKHNLFRIRLRFFAIKFWLMLCFLSLPIHSYAQVAYYNFAQSLYNADVTIGAAPTSNGSFLAPGVFTPDASANLANVNVTELMAYLNTGTTVTINTANTSGTGAGNIVLGTAMTWTGISPAVALNLNASNDVNINGATTTTTGSYSFNAYDNVNIGGAMTVTTGNMSFLAGNNVNLNSAASITTGDFTAIAGGWANMNAPITVVSGSTTIISGGGRQKLMEPLFLRLAFCWEAFFSYLGLKKCLKTY